MIISLSMASLYKCVKRPGVNLKCHCTGLVTLVFGTDPLTVLGFGNWARLSRK